MLYASLDGIGLLAGMETCVYMPESPHCSPKTSTILLIGYTPIQNGFVVKVK